MKFHILTVKFVVLLILTLLPSDADSRESEWPTLLLIYQGKAKQAVARLFDPSNPDVTTPIETYSTGGWINKRAITGSAITDTICYESWTFECTKAGKPFITTNVLIGVDDDTNSHFKKKLHIDLNPFDGKHIMYLEPIRQAIWYMNLESRHGKLVLTSDNHTVEFFAMDWTAGRLFTLHRTKGYISAWKLTSGATEKLYSFGAASVSSMACNSEEGALYWTTLDGSVYMSFYSDQGEVRRVAGRGYCSSLASSIAEETRRTSQPSRVRPLMYHQGSMFCIARKGTGATYDLVKIQGPDGETEEEKIPLPSASGVFALLGTYTDWRSDSHYRHISKTCEKCSHLCIPVAGNQKFECACPFGFNLINRTTCENPFRLALLGQFATSDGSTSPPNYSLMIRDFMYKSNDTVAVDSEEYFLVPTDVSQYFCLHFRSGNGSIECLPSNFKPETPRWTVPLKFPKMNVTKVSRHQNLDGHTEWVVFYFEQNSKSLMIYTTEGNGSKTLADTLDPQKIVIDHLNWILYYSDTNGSVFRQDLREAAGAKLVSSPWRSIKIQELFVDPYTSTLAIIGEDNKIATFNCLNGRLTTRRVENGMRIHSATLFEDNLLWIDGEDHQQLAMADLDEFAGAEYLYRAEGNRTTLKLQYAVLDTRDNVARECSNRTCFHLCGADEPYFKCWCAKYDHQDCQDFQLNLGLRKRTGPQVHTYSVTTFSQGLEFSEVATFDGTESDDVYMFHPRAKALCYFKPGESNNALIRCGEHYGMGIEQEQGLIGRETSLKLQFPAFKFVTPSIFTKNYIYWTSRFKDGACLNVAPVSENSGPFELGCVLQTASKMEHPVYDVKRNLLFWCADSELKIYNFATSSLIVKPLETRCAGLSFQFQSADTIYVLLRTKIQAFKYTVDDAWSPNVQLKLYETWRISTHSPAAFKITDDFFLWTDKIKNGETVVQALPFDQKLTEPVQKNVYQVPGSVISVDILHFTPEQKLGEDPCDHVDCQFYCSVGLNNKPWCACPIDEPPDFGKKHVNCDNSTSETTTTTGIPGRGTTAVPGKSPTASPGGGDKTPGSLFGLWIFIIGLLIVICGGVAGFMAWKKYETPGVGQQSAVAWSQVDDERAALTSTSEL